MTNNDSPCLLSTNLVWMPSIFTRSLFFFPKEAHLAHRSSTRGMNTKKISDASREELIAIVKQLHSKLQVANSGAVQVQPVAQSAPATSSPCTEGLLERIRFLESTQSIFFSEVVKPDAIAPGPTATCVPREESDDRELKRVCRILQLDAALQAQIARHSREALQLRTSDAHDMPSGMPGVSFANISEDRDIMVRPSTCDSEAQTDDDSLHDDTVSSSELAKAESIIQGLVVEKREREERFRAALAGVQALKLSDQQKGQEIVAAHAKIHSLEEDLRLLREQNCHSEAEWRMKLMSAETEATKLRYAWDFVCNARSEYMGSLIRSMSVDHGTLAVKQPCVTDIEKDIEKAIRRLQTVRIDSMDSLFERRPVDVPRPLPDIKPSVVEFDPFS